MSADETLSPQEGAIALIAAQTGLAREDLERLRAESPEELAAILASYQTANQDADPTALEEAIRVLGIVAEIAKPIGVIAGAAASAIGVEKIAAK